MVLDGQKSGKIDRVLSDAVVHQLHEAVKNTSNMPSSSVFLQLTVMLLLCTLIIQTLFTIDMSRVLMETFILFIIFHVMSDNMLTC